MFFKDQINVINKNREGDVKSENGVKVEEGELDNVNYRCIGHKFKDFFNNVF